MSWKNYTRTSSIEITLLEWIEEILVKFTFLSSWNARKFLMPIPVLNLTLLIDPFSFIYKFMLNYSLKTGDSFGQLFLTGERIEKHIAQFNKDSDKYVYLEGITLKNCTLVQGILERAKMRDFEYVLPPMRLSVCSQSSVRNEGI